MVSDRWDRKRIRDWTVVMPAGWNRAACYFQPDAPAGPPTVEDDAWFTQTVASLGYPKGKRDPKPMKGQMTIDHPPIIVNPTFDEAIEKFTFDRTGLWEYVGGTWRFLGDSNG